MNSCKPTFAHPEHSEKAVVSWTPPFGGGWIRALGVLHSLRRRLTLLRSDTIAENIQACQFLNYPSERLFPAWIVKKKVLLG